MIISSATVGTSNLRKHFGAIHRTPLSLAAVVLAMLMALASPAGAEEGIISPMDLGKHLVVSGAPNIKTAASSTFDMGVNYSVEFWIRPALLDGVYRPIVATSNSFSDGFVIAMQHNFLILQYFGTSTFLTPIYFTNAQEWIHVAITVQYDGVNTIFRFYKNGAQLSQSSVAGQILIIPSNAGLAIAGTPGNISGGRYQGAIDEVRVWNIIRSAAQIADNFDKLIDPASLNLVGYWRFDELVDQQTGVAGPNDFQDLSRIRAHLDVTGAGASLQTLGTVYHGSGTSGYSTIGVGDVNGDGLEDFAVGNHASPQVKLVYGRLPQPTPAPLAATAQNSCSNAEEISLFQVYTGTTAGGTNDGSATCGTSSTSPDVWYQFIPDFTGEVIASTHGSLYDTVLSVHSGCPGDTGNQIVCNDDHGNLQSLVRFDVIKGNEYYVRVSGFNGAAGSFRLLLTSPHAANRVDLDNLSPEEGVTITGASSAFYGAKVSGVGDVNGDGYQDFIIAAESYDRPGASDSGAAFLIFGNATPPIGSGIGTNGLLDVADLNGLNGVAFLGANASDIAGYRVGGAGDVNGDGLDDFLITAYQFDPPSVSNGGAVYVIFGSRSGFGIGGQMDLAEIGSLNDLGISGTRIDNIFASAGLGDWVAGAGDVNGDGYDDFLISSHSAQGGQGVVWLIYGSARNDETGVGIGRDGILNLSNSAKDWDQNGLADGLYFSRIDGTVNNTNFGNTLSGAGDVNGDGFNDFLIGAYASNSFAGNAYLFYGRSTALGDSTGIVNLNSYLNGSTGIRFIASNLDITQYHGWSVGGAGDINGDGYADLLVGAFPNSPGNRTNAGSAYVLLGQAAAYANASSVDLATLPRDNLLLWQGGTSGDFLGYDVSSLGDINGDHVADYAISSPFKSPHRVFVFNGKNTAASGLYRNRIRHGVGPLLGQLQTYLEVPPKAVGAVGDASHSIPLSSVEVGFTGGQSGVKKPSTQSVRLYRQAAPNSYIFDEGGDNETPFAPVPLVWHMTTDRVEFEISTVILYYTPKDIEGLTQDQIDTMGVFRSTVNPFGGGTASSDWIPVVEAVHDQVNRRFVVTRTHDPAVGVPSPSQTEFNGYYSIFAGETKYALGSIISPTVKVDVNKLPSVGPLVSPPDAAHWHAGQKKLFATKAYATVLIQWINDTDPNKPSMDVTVATFVWPGSAVDFFDNTNIGTYQYHVANTPPVKIKATDQGGKTISSVQVRDTEAIIDISLVQSTGDFSALGQGRTLLMLSDGNPSQDGLWFQFLWTLPFINNFTTTDMEVAVGTDLGPWGEATDNIHTMEAGEPYFMNEFGFYNADQGYYDRSKAPATGPLIPVNTDLTGQGIGGDDFDVTFYQLGGKMVNALDSNDTPSFVIHWPWYPVRLDVQWPVITDPLKTIVIASQRGANLPTSEVIDPFIYYNNERYLAGDDGELGTPDDVPTLGYNPNEEHALLILLNEGWAAFALRDDLARPDTSEPFVLVKHLDPSNSNRRAMTLFKVEREDNDDTFYYSNPPAVVSNPIEPFFPLRSTLFPLCPPSVPGGVDGNRTTTPDKVWQDRTGRLWTISAGLLDDEAADVGMRFFYRLRDGFYMPQEYVDALRTRSDIYPEGPNNEPFEFGIGTCIPCLDDWWDEGTQQASASVGIPQEVLFKVVWPLDAPSLQVAETLVDPKRGLPGIDGNESVHLLFQQSNAQDSSKRSVQLIDPTRERWIPLTELPGGMATARVMGRLEFEDLAPHLRRRLIYDDNADRLIWRGQFVRFIAGEDMLLPNVMTSRERDAIKEISDATEWGDAIDELYDSTQQIIPIAVATFLREDVTNSVAATNGVAAGDINGDGFPDIVTSSASSDNVALFLNPGAGGGAWPSPIVVGGSPGGVAFIAHSLAIGDIDGDSDLDIVGGSTDGKISWFENTAGDGSAWSTRSIYTGSNDHVIVKLADLDKDNDLDIVAGVNETGILWFENDGTPKSVTSSDWTQRTVKTVTSADRMGVAVGDVNNDGHLDIIGASGNVTLQPGDTPADGVAWFKNDGTPKTVTTSDWVQTGIEAGGSIPEVVVVADLDQNGSLDVLAAFDLTDTIKWYKNANGLGTSWQQAVISSDAQNVKDILVADLDGDTDLDVASASFDDDKLSWYDNVGVLEPRFNEEVITRNADLAKSLAVADFDLDGALDIVATANHKENNVQVSTVAIFRNDGSRLDAWDSLALTSALATGTGFVTLGFNNKEDAQSIPFVEVIRVDCPLYTGDLKIIYPDCPFDDKVALRHSGDFAGTAELYEFEWKYMDAATYLQISQETGFPPSNDHPLWTEFPFDTQADKIGAVDIRVQGGSGELVLSDLFWIMRYRPVDGPNHVCGSNYSPWTGVGLTEGWVKRVVGDFGPFNQRATGGGIQGAEDNFVDYRNRTVNTVVSMISQAGERWEGNVPLTCLNVDGLGLIEVYQTVLNRAIQLSLDAAPRINLDANGDGIPDTSATAGVSNALLLAASRIADLYTLLGNEAYADASDPTIVFGTDDGTFGAFATSLHPFMNQTATLLEEELALLRGRDNTKLPDIKIRPFYNRLIWNFTNDFVGGEVAYVLNYGISDVNGDSRIDEGDAAQLFPQAHGDAWGHYLSAIKAYYYLIRRPEFAWVPRTEPVLVAGIPVEVDYFDERKFAEVAAAFARAGKEIVNLTYRASYVEKPDGQWQGYKDTRPGRHWGLSEWGSRAGQAAYYNWIVANGLLPPDNGQGEAIDIRKIDRSTVGELQEIAGNMLEIQRTLDEADGGLNPLGLAKGVVPFDINPVLLTSTFADPIPHFEQIYGRAEQAIVNAQTVFDYATAATLALRKQADTVSDFQVAVEDQEIDYINRLIEIFGTPYPDDIGPGKTYPSGYYGPDLIHWMYYDPAQVEFTDIAQDERQIEATFRKDLNYAEIVDNLHFDFTDDVLTDSGITKPPTSIGQDFTVTFNVSDKLGPRKPNAWTAPRQVYGELQIAQLEWLRLILQFRRDVDNYDGLVLQMDDKVQLLEAQWNVKASQVKIRNTAQNTLIGLDVALFVAKTSERVFTDIKETLDEGTQIALEASPTSLGFSNDVGAIIRGTAKSIEFAGQTALTVLAAAANLLGEGIEITKGQVEKQADLAVELASDVFEIQQAIAEIRDLLLNDTTLRFAIMDTENQIMQAGAKYSAILGKGEQILEERSRFRRKTASRVQLYRYKDMAYRIFRNEAVQKYRAQFDLASRYAFLAANSYDYETNLLGTDTNGPGEQFLTQIVRSRALGRISDGHPQLGFSQGDPGLADVLARMKLNWDLSLRNQLGFTNPQVETNRFSLRRELYRIGLESDASPGGISEDEAAARWREILSRPYGGINSSGIVANIFDVPEFRQYAIPFTGQSAVPEPAIVIRFGTNVNFAQNYFVNFDEGQAWPLGAGDSSYDTTNFATKIRSMGSWFVNYNTLAGSGMSNTPRIYLFPTGSDVMRSPTGNRGAVRKFNIIDQAIPAPFPLGGAALSDPMYVPSINSLGESFITIRRFPSFRAYHSDQSYLDSINELDTTQLSYDSRLIGRSVWNTEWYMIIPGGTLHSNRQEGLRRFIYGKLGTAPDGSFVLDDQGQQRNGNGVQDILLFFETYAYSGI